MARADNFPLILAKISIAVPSTSGNPKNILTGKESFFPTNCETSLRSLTTFPFELSESAFNRIT